MSSRYYNQPLLKPPVWTWEVPAYFFVGGVAGVAAVIAAVGAIAGADLSLVRHARWIAVIGALISPALLISDLGRPDRFVNMLRVFKAQSPMSVGAWTLAVFTPAVLAALVWDPATATSMAARVAGHAGSVAGAATGLVLATYTGVLIGVTVIPVWTAHVRHLPFHFGASSLGAAVATLELLGHRTPAMNVLGILAAAGLTLMRAHVEADRRPASRPLKTGPSGSLTRLGDVLSGPVPLILRLVWAADPLARAIAASAAIAGSAITRFGWMSAGRASVTLALATLLLTPAPMGLDATQRAAPELDTRAIVALASRYVARYQDEFAFLLADEVHTQTVSTPDGRVIGERRMTGELFLTYLAGEGEWMAVHDFAEVDGTPVPDREDVRALLSRSDVRGVGGRVADRNARYNIGRVVRNFNQPMLPLLLLGPKRVKGVQFERQEVIPLRDRTLVGLRFSEREPSLVQSVRGAMRYLRGTMTIDATTGRVERTEIEIKTDVVLSRLTTEYALDDKLELWVPTVFRERYESSHEGYRELVRCESRYTNYRRFETTGRIKKVSPVLHRGGGTER